MAGTSASTRSNAKNSVSNRKSKSVRGADNKSQMNCLMKELGVVEDKDASQEKGMML